MAANPIAELIAIRQVADANPAEFNHRYRWQSRVGVNREMLKNSGFHRREQGGIYTLNRVPLSILINKENRSYIGKDKIKNQFGKWITPFEEPADDDVPDERRHHDLIYSGTDTFNSQGNTDLKAMKGTDRTVRVLYHKKFESYNPTIYAVVFLGIMKVVDWEDKIINGEWCNIFYLDLVAR